MDGIKFRHFINYDFTKYYYLTENEIFAVTYISERAITHLIKVARIIPALRYITTVHNVCMYIYNVCMDTLRVTVTNFSRF